MISVIVILIFVVIKAGSTETEGKGQRALPGLSLLDIGMHTWWVAQIDDLCYRHFDICSDHVLRCQRDHRITMGYLLGEVVGSSNYCRQVHQPKSHAGDYAGSSVKQ